MTRGELLKFCLGQALRKVRLGGKRLALSEHERNAVAAEAVNELRRYGGWQLLDEEAPTKHAAPATSGDDKSEEWKGKPD